MSSLISCRTISRRFSLLPIAVIKTTLKSNMERRVYLAHISLSQSVTEGSQGRDSSRNLEMGAAQETTEEGCLLARSLWRGRFALLDTQDPLARVVPPKVGQALSPQSSVRKMSRSLAYLSRTRAFFSLESPSSQMVPACVKLTGK